MSTTILGGVIFILVFAGIILIHEFGHFFVCRLTHIGVEEFAIGFPPRLFRFWRSPGYLVIGNEHLVIPRNFELPFDHKTAISRMVEASADRIHGRLVLRSIKLIASENDQAVSHQPDNPQKAPMMKAGEIPISGTLHDVSPGTEFTLNLIPLGGYNRIKGGDNPEIKDGMAAASPWKRIPVLLGGATMNLLAALVVYMLIFSQTGVPDTSRVEILQVLPDMPAEAAGFKVGDVILSINGQNIQATTQAISMINSLPGQELSIAVKRGEEVVQLFVTPRITPSDGKGRIGVALGNPSHPVNSVLETIPISFRAEAGFIDQLLSMPGQLIAGTLSPQEAQIGGPRTIWNLFQQAVARDTASRQPSSSSSSPTPSFYTLLLIISLNVSVGVFNLFPIPGLDGMHIFMALIEVITRRPIPARLQMMINGVGLIVFLVVLGGFYIKDIISPLNVTLP